MPARHRFRGLLPAIFLLMATALPMPARSQDGSDVPFITTPDNVTVEMLQIAKVGPGDHVIDLGSGDGRIVITAARRFGATGLGVEIVPELISRSLANAQVAGVASRVDFREQDLFQTDLSPATVVTMYLLPEVNLRLRPAILALRPGTRVVSHDWNMGDWLPDDTKVVPVPDKKVGLQKSSKIHLWIVPASVHGLWCGSARRESLQLTQQYQQVRGTLGGRAIDGRMEGSLLRTTDFVAHASTDAIRIQTASGAAAGLQGQVFRRAVGHRCD